MELQKIQSRKSEKVKAYCRLLDSKKARQKEGLFCLEGLRLSLDAVRSGYQIQTAFVTREALSKSAQELHLLLQEAAQSFEISEDVAEKMADTVTPQGVFCVVHVPQEKTSFALQKGKQYVALDHVQNPQNLGSIARTAEALGIAGLVVQGGCDPYNPKALRASMGSLLRLPILESEDLKETLLQLPKEICSFATVPDCTAKDIRKMNFKGGALAIIGNEGNGVSQEVLDAARERVTIPMLGRAESLNAATAATITMWEMMK